MIVSIKFEDNEKIVTLCDDDLLGKRLNEDFYINPRFYSGKKLDRERIVEELKDATIINAIGKNSVSLCLNLGYIDESSIKKINEIPHAIMVLMK